MAREDVSHTDRGACMHHDESQRQRRHALSLVEAHPAGPLDATLRDESAARTLLTVQVWAAPRASSGFPTTPVQSSGGGWYSSLI